MLNLLEESSHLGCNRRYLWRPSGAVDDSGDLCEIVKFSDEPRSWFVNNSIQTGMGLGSADMGCMMQY